MPSGFFQNLFSSPLGQDIQEIILPFLLIFTLVFSVLQRTSILGKNKKVNLAVSIVLGLLVIIPHVTGAYPQGLDVVQVINDSLPMVVLVIVAILLAMIMIGAGGGKFKEDKEVPALAIILATVFVVYIFGASAGFWQPFFQLTYLGDDVIGLVIALLIFGTIVMFVTSDDDNK